MMKIYLLDSKDVAQPYPLLISKNEDHMNVARVLDVLNNSDKSNQDMSIPLSFINHGGHYPLNPEQLALVEKLPGKHGAYSEYGMIYINQAAMERLKALTAKEEQFEVEVCNGVSWDNLSNVSNAFNPRMNAPASQTPPIQKPEPARRILTAEQQQRQDALLKAEEEALLRIEKSRKEDRREPMRFQEPIDAFKGEQEKITIERTKGYKQLLKGSHQESAKELIPLRAQELKKQRLSFLAIDKHCRKLSDCLEDVKHKLAQYELHLHDKNDPVARSKKTLISTMKNEIDGYLRVTRNPPRTTLELSKFDKKMNRLGSLFSDANLRQLSEARTKEEDGIIAKIKLCFMRVFNIKSQGEGLVKELKKAVEDSKLGSITTPRFN